MTDASPKSQEYDDDMEKIINDIEITNVNKKQNAKTLQVSNEIPQSIQHFIKEEPYYKIKEQLVKASELYQKDEKIKSLLYSYIRSCGKGEIIPEQNKEEKISEQDLRGIVEAALDNDLYILARNALKEYSLRPKDRDLLKKAFTNNSSGQIKLVTRLLLKGGPLYSQIDIIQQVEIRQKIVDLVDNQHDKAAQYLVELCKKYNISLQFPFKIIQEAFLKKTFGFLQSYLNCYNLRIESSHIFDLVIKTLEDSDTFVDGVYFLQFISIKKMNEEYMLKIIDIMEEILDNNILILTKCVAPQVTVSVLADFVDDLVPRFKRFQVRLLGLRDSLKDMAITFMEEMSDALALERLYLKSVLPCKESLVELYLKKKVFYQELLNYQIVADFLQRNFNGKYKSDNNFLIASSCLKTIFGEDTQPIIKAQKDGGSQDNRKKNFLGFIRSNKQEIEGVHNWFQYGIWKSSALFRLIISITFHLAAIIFVLTISLQFFEEMRIMHTKIPHEMLVLQNDLQVYQKDPVDSNITQIIEDHIIIDLEHQYGAQTYQSFSDERKAELRQEVIDRIKVGDIWDLLHELEPDYYDEVEELKKDEEALDHTLKILEYIPFYFIVQWFVSVFEIVNLYKRKGQVSSNILHIIDTIQLVLNIIIAYELFEKILTDDYTLLEKIDVLDYLEKLQAGCLFVLWAKFLVYLKITQKFGVIIRIIEMSMVDILNFLIILLVIEMAFVTLFFILFEDVNDDFSTFFITVRSATSMILGNFDVTTFEADQELGAVLVIVYMIITNVLALNLLIAILSTTYEKISEMSTVEFSSIVYDYQKFTKSSKYYTSLTCAPGPLNLAAIPFQTLVTITNSKAIDSFCLKLIYAMELLVFFYPLFLTFNLILSPFAFLANFINIIRTNNTFQAIIKVITWLFIGLLYTLFVAIVLDSILFIKMCFMQTYVRESLEKVCQNSHASVSRYAKNNTDKVLGLEEAVNAVLQDSFTNQKSLGSTNDDISKKEQNLEKKDSVKSTGKVQDVEMLKSEYDNDEIEEVLTQHRSLGVKEILSKFIDHKESINFGQVQLVMDHCKKHKISMVQGMVHCHNYQEIESALLKVVLKKEEEAQSLEDFQKLYEQKAA